jgi:hypothetical protein
MKVVAFGTILLAQSEYSTLDAFVQKHVFHSSLTNLILPETTLTTSQTVALSAFH